MYSKHHIYLENAKKLRTAQTPWETKLWYYLRGNRFYGFKFKRQVPIGPYIADFCCNEKKLIIELDGGQHSEMIEKQKDADKQTYLEKNGYAVLHFWNNDVDSNIAGVLEVIKQQAFRPLS